MTQAISGASTIPRGVATFPALSFTVHFEELPLFWQHADAIAWRGGLMDGEFEVSVYGPTDWIITDVAVACDNGKCGAEAKGKLIALNADTDERLYLLVLDAIDHKYASYIEERIAEDAGDRGLRLVA